MFCSPNRHVHGTQESSLHTTPPTVRQSAMNVFNPQILNASIQSCLVFLNDSQKVDILLHALERIPADRQPAAKGAFENAIQSVLNVPGLTAQHAKALVLRGKSRLAVGSHMTATNDFQAALAADPRNVEAASILNVRPVFPVESVRKGPGGPSFSTEVWHGIALFLPKSDLKTLLHVPHTLSQIASQLLFRTIDLHFAMPVDPDDERRDAWRSQTSAAIDREHDARYATRSADILTRIIVDEKFASLVKTLRVYYPRREKDGSMSFQIGMLANAIPKLSNLINVHITAGADGLLPIIRVVQSCKPSLHELSLLSTDGHVDLGPLEFKHLRRISYTTTGGSDSDVAQILARNWFTLRSVRLINSHWTFPTNAMTLRNLTHIDFFGHFAADNRAIAEILDTGRQVESLKLSCILSAGPSAHFRAHSHLSMPFLRHFAFNVVSAHPRITDTDLFPAISEFLRGRSQLRTLRLTLPEAGSLIFNGDGRLTVSEADGVQRQLGYDAGAWSALPTMTSLRGLTMTYPRDLSPGLACWLIPRTLRALDLRGISLLDKDIAPFLKQLRPGVPPNLRYIGMGEFPLHAVMSIVEHGFPMVKVVKVGTSYWTVSRKKADREHVSLESWPKTSVLFHKAEWLESHGCEDAEWRSLTDFAS